MAPHLGDRRDVEVEIATRFCMQREAFGQRLHHSVLDAVVDHLDEVAGDPAGRNAASRASGAGARIRTYGVDHARPLRRRRRTSAHSRCRSPQTPPDTPQSTKRMSALGERRRASLRILVVRVAAVDDEVALRKRRGQRLRSRARSDLRPAPSARRRAAPAMRQPVRAGEPAASITHSAASASTDACVRDRSRRRARRRATRRRAMLPPMRPRPTMPMSISRKRITRTNGSDGSS